MRFFDWILGKAETADENIPPAPVPATRPKVNPPNPLVEDDEELQHPDDAGEIELDPVYITIDYSDSVGNKSRRRITTLKAKRGPHAPILSAKCHERGAQRSFRTDRIDCFIDEDGEVFDVDFFFRDCLLIDLAELAPDNSQPAKNPKRETPDALIRARNLREVLRAPLSVLVLAAKADDEFHLNELEVICCYAEDEIEANDLPARAEELTQLTGLISKMNPRPDSLERLYTEVLKYDETRFQRFEKALLDVIAADGIITQSEENLLADLHVARNKAVN